ncbi:MAG: hypothetical protein AMXMBFR13_34250 [Phycisphaerae bacterium]
MGLDYRILRDKHPQLLKWIIVMKTARTKVGIALIVFCVGAEIWQGRMPYHLHEANRWVFLGLCFIFAGLGLRLAACGSIRKKERLATTGVYSLCRHPLYLGSVFLVYGFCFLLRDASNFAIATVYFLLFYPLTIAWEEVRLAERYGGAHAEYAGRVPLLLPIGRFQSGEFRLGEALSRGGARLTGCIIGLLALIEGFGEAVQHGLVPGR